MPSADVKGVVKRVSFADLPKVDSNGGIETVDLSSDVETLPKSVTSVMNRILTAITKRTKGQATEYYAIVDLLGKGKSLDPEELQMWISAVSLCVSHLSSSCQSLVNELLRVSWLSQSDAFVAVYAHFLEVFVSAQSIHAVAVTEMLVQSFRFESDKETLTTKFFPRIHSALKGVLRLIPTGPSLLLPLLTKYFPHKSEGLESHCLYIENLLQVLEYTPHLRHGVWNLILERTIQIDAEIQLEMEDMDDDDWNEFQDGQFDQYRDPENEELEDAESEREEEDSDIYSDDELGLSPLSLDVKKLVLKLDAILQLLLTQIKTSLTTTESSDNFLCHTFMVLFESLILPTHRIRCTQFLIFYTCSLDSAFSDDFMGLLAGKIFELNQPTGTRISAASYFASYVARAKYVDSKAVKTCQKLLVQYATSYLDKNEAQVSQKSIGKHGIFYAVVQAILYIFCFRWRDFIQSEEEEEVVVVQASLPSEMTGFQRILTSKLSPLKVCSTHIVDEFARITCSLNMLYCYPFMTKDASSNWRLTNDDNTINTDSTTLHTPTKGSSQELSTLILDRLDTFFPFDPLTLPQSKRFMDGLYQEWTGPTDDESDDGESKSDEDDDDGETEGEEVMAMSYTLTSTSIE